MSFNQRCYSRTFVVLASAMVMLSSAVFAQDYSSMSISDVLAAAERRLQEKNYEGAIPALKEVLDRTSGLTDPQGQKTAQTCRLELARVYYQLGQVSEGMPYIDEYLNNEPREQEALALRMLAQAFFDVSDWDKIIDLAKRLQSFPGLNKDDLFNMNLLVGQAYFQKGDYENCVEPLKYAERNTDDDRIQGICQIMVTRALVELKEWEQLYPWVLKINRTERRFDISLNLTLMKAGMALFDSGEYLNSLYLYRMVMPRGVLLDHANQKIEAMNKEITLGGLNEAEVTQRQAEIDGLKDAVQQLRDLPPYEEEVSFRIGQIYADVKRYWEGYVAFDRLSREYGDSSDKIVQEIVEAAELQAVMTMYALKDVDRAEGLVFDYLKDKPEGKYARTMLSIMMRDRLLSNQFEKVVELQPYVDRIPASEDLNERRTQADLKHMLGFGYLQTGEYNKAATQFESVLSLCRGEGAGDEGDLFGVDPEGVIAPNVLYYRGMSHLLLAQYEVALEDFREYQETYKTGAQYPDSIFREAVCLYGLERIKEAEDVFTSFIESYPNSELISEAYSMRGDIEAAKEASVDDPLTLDRAQADYRRAIDSAITPMQASYPAFQAAKTYKMESKWQEIIDLMNYYMLRWEEMADIAEAVFWIGQSQTELGQLQEEAVPAYVDAIMRYGNDPQRVGVDKIINELVTIAAQKLSPEDRDSLAIRLKLKLASVDENNPVLRLRLQFAQALLEGEDVAEALAAKLLETIDTKVTTPLSLSVMCDVAVDTGNVEQMERLANYFITTFPDADLLWHGYRARVTAMLEHKNYTGALAAIDDAQNGPYELADMGWAQLIKANLLYEMGDYAAAEEEYNRLMGVPQWRGPLSAQATLGIGKARMAAGDLEGAHVFFQRTYLMFKAFDNGKWAADGYLAAADCLNQLGRKADAIKTLKAMLEDDYTKDQTPDEVRALLKNYEGQ